MTSDVIKKPHTTSSKTSHNRKTRVWDDVWRCDVAFKILYPRVYSLETIKNILVASKLFHEDMGSSLRRSPRGGAEQAQFSNMCAIVEGTFIAVMRIDGCGRWTAQICYGSMGFKHLRLDGVASNSSSEFPTHGLVFKTEEKLMHELVLQWRLRQKLVADVELANNLLHELNRYLEQLRTRAPGLLRVEALPDDPLIKYGFSALE
nr:hypothetical protein [Tanacetum cinerariifolium]